MKEQTKKLPGIDYIYYREHPTRKVSEHSKKPDIHYSSQYRVKGIARPFSNAFGWASDGWTPEEALRKTKIYQANRLTGEWPTSWKEECKGRAEQLEKAKEHTVAALFEKRKEAKKLVVTERWQATLDSLFRDYIKEAIGGIEITKLASEHVLSVLSGMEGKSEMTKKHVYNILRGVFLYAKSKELVTGEFPGKGVLPRADPQNQREYYFSEEQIQAILKDLRGDAEPAEGLKGKMNEHGSIDAYGQALISVRCGLRAGEIFELRWQDIDFENKKGRLINTKDANKTRYFFWVENDGVEEMLKERLTYSPFTEPLDYVFGTSSGTKAKEVSKIFERCFIRLKINKPGEKDRKRKAVFHSFRHTYAANMAISGVPLHLLQKFLGHQQLKTTQRYISHSNEDDQRNAIQRMHNHLKRQKIT